MSQRINSPDCEAVLHYVTVNVRERKCPFARPEYAQLVLRQLRFECNRHPAGLLAYVVMPDHLHFLLALSDGKLGRFLSRFKPNTTLNLDAAALKEGRHRDRLWLWQKGRRELWQDSKHSLHLFSPSWIEQKIRYIHDNPVRKGLVASAIDYPWSSVAAFQGGLPPEPVDFDYERFFCNPKRG